MKRIIQADEIKIAGVPVTPGGGGGAGVLSALAQSDNAPVFTDNVAFLFHPNTVLNDPSSLYNSTTGIWKIPADVVGTVVGSFNIAITGAYNYTGHATVYFRIKKNGAYYRSSAPFGTEFVGENPGFNGIVDFHGVAGDEFEIDIKVIGTGGALTTGFYSWAAMTIYLNVSAGGGGGSKIRFSSVETLTNITIPAGTPTLYQLDGTNLIESEPMYNSATGQWTVPSDVVGYKMASLDLAAIGDIETATDNFTIQLYKNGSYYRQQGANYSLANDRINMKATINFPVQANDVIKVYLVPENAQHVLGAGVGGNFASLTVWG